MPKVNEKEVSKTKKTLFYQAVGRRKRATARVRLYPVLKGKIIVNEKELAKNDFIVNGRLATVYFPGEVSAKKYLEPLRLTDNLDRFAISAKVEGSGLSSQLGAVVHGISKALLLIDKETYRLPLKKSAFLTRDPREKERRKAGLAGKARAGKQSPKR